MKKSALKIIAAALMAAAMMLSATGCSSSGSAATATPAPSAAPTAAPTEAPKTLKVAVLLPGSVNDQGWNATAYNGLMMIKDTYGAEVSYSESVAASDYEQVYRGYASQGYNIVIGHGAEFADAAKAVAKDFPDVFFGVTSSSEAAEPNVFAITNDNIQQGFLAGCAAGLLTKSNVIGCVAGMELSSIAEYCEGFKKGVLYVNPDATVLVTFTGSFDDAAKAKESANAMISQGADVLTHDADQSGLSVLDAAKEAGVMALGCVADQSSYAPDTVVTSSINDAAAVYLAAAEKYMAGTLEGKAYKLGIADGTVDLAGYGTFDNKLSDDFKSQIDTIKADLKADKIDLSALPTE